MKKNEEKVRIWVTRQEPETLSIGVYYDHGGLRRAKG